MQTNDYISGENSVENTAISVRLGTEADVAFAAALERESFPDPWRAEDIAVHVESSHLVFFVAEEEGTPCGYLLGMHIPPEGEIYRVAVSPAYRRRGVGASLCFALLSRCELCDLEVRRSNASARALYESLGFSLVGERKNYYKDPVEDACLYRRK